MKILGPDDPWPAHSKKWFRDAYEVARNYGWTCEPHSSHTGSAKLRCPSGQCDYLVFGTGADGETAAKQLVKKIQRCPHAVTPRPLQKANEFMDQAERLLDAVDKIRESQEREATAGGLLFDESFASESEVYDLWREAQQLMDEAAHVLGELTVADATADAVSALSEARTLIGRTPPSPQVKDAKQRLRALQQRCEASAQLIAESQADG